MAVPEVNWTWLSCHVFYHADTDPLLVDLLLPMLDDLRRRKLVRRRFYLRHWERGPHIRVRMQVPDEHRDAVRTEVERVVTAYLLHHPGPADTDPDRLREARRRLSRLEHGTDDPGELLRTVEPANSLRWIDYLPELDKYGGPTGVAIAEDVFDASTSLAGNVVRLVADDRARLGVALQFLLLASRSLGLDAEQRVVFLRHYHHRWLGYLPDTERLLPAWDRQYTHQQATYASTLAALDAGDEVGRTVGRRWELAMTSTLTRLRPLVDQGAVWPAEVDRSAPPFVAMAALVSQYLHTTNNRMNVRPQGECFVAYLAHRAAVDRVRDGSACHV